MPFDRPVAKTLAVSFLNFFSNSVVAEEHNISLL